LYINGFAFNIHVLGTDKCAGLSAMNPWVRHVGK